MKKAIGSAVVACGLLFGAPLANSEHSYTDYSVILNHPKRQNQIRLDEDTKPMCFDCANTEVDDKNLCCVYEGRVTLDTGHTTKPSRFIAEELVKDQAMFTRGRLLRIYNADINGTTWKLFGEMLAKE